MLRGIRLIRQLNPSESVLLSGNGSQGRMTSVRVLEEEEEEEEEEEFRMDSEVRCDGAHPLCCALSRRGN